MQKVVILGGSGIGMTVAAIAEQYADTEVLGFLNDIEPVGSYIGNFKKIPVIGKTDDLPGFLNDKDVMFFIAYVGMQNEKEVYQKIVQLNIPSERFFTCIDKTAVFYKDYCKIGSGVLLTPLSQVGVDVTLSDNCMLLANSYVGHNSFLDRFAHIATNAVVGANVHVGKAVHVGSNATIREKIIIGDFSLIGAGAVVIKDVPPNSIVVGNPARILRTKEE
ncbi:MAG: hypothetical protein Q4C95_00990 [Planctomycetia bacterium]|nr:hypothetical protein [Planctomycetia bacterium]